MQITVADLPQIRRLEAVSFRSFPATTTYFNGTWAVRLSAGLKAKRLNSVSPLDPKDNWKTNHRLKQEIQRFTSFGRPLVFRLTPLAPEKLIHYLQDLNWMNFDKSVVMLADLTTMPLEHAQIRTPFNDTGSWVDAMLNLNGENFDLKPGNVEVIKSIQGVTGLFLRQDSEGEPQCALRAVLDNDLVGLFSVATSSKERRSGIATSLVLSSLAWARHQGAKLAWLQVEESNIPAIALYEKLGFKPFYCYVYSRPPANDGL